MLAERCAVAFFSLSDCPTRADDDSADLRKTVLSSSTADRLSNDNTGPARGEERNVCELRLDGGGLEGALNEGGRRSGGFGNDIDV